MMKFHSVFLLGLFTTPIVLVAHRQVTPSSADKQDEPLLRRDKECPDGFHGTNCANNINECQASPYPCAGGNRIGSFCVDYDPPKKFKCGCLPGYEALLPNASYVMDNVTIEWRPLKCLARDVCVGFVCHEDAICTVSSNNTAVCVCNGDLIGDGIANCSPAPKTVASRTKPPATQSKLGTTCNNDSDCDKVENSICVEGVCKCKSGFYQNNAKGSCKNENECADGYPNDCHKNSICKDTEGSYTCTCKDGYSDLDPDAKAGTICAQINECVHPSMNNCNSETQVCLDYPPPKKWECIERTPAPTPFPTLNPQEFNCRSSGFTSAALCIACSFLQLRSASDCESTSAVNLDLTPLAGTIPSQIGLLTKLTSLSLIYTQLKGTIPKELAKLSNLHFLYLQYNGLTGPIPTELGNLGSLNGLYLHYNGLTGPIPTELGNLSHLNSLHLENNGLTGPIPTELANLGSLLSLYLNNNGLTGPIPTELANLGSLLSLFLNNNGLTGHIPTVIQDFCSRLWFCGLL